MHDISASGHLGQLKTKNPIIAHCTWPGILKDICVYSKTCDVCQRVDKTDLKTHAQMIKSPIIDKVSSGISVDLVGPQPQYTNIGNRFILKIMEHSLRWSYAVAIPDHTAQTEARKLFKYFTLFFIDVTLF